MRTKSHERREPATIEEVRGVNWYTGSTNAKPQVTMMEDADHLGHRVWVCRQRGTANGTSSYREYASFPHRQACWQYYKSTHELGLPLHLYSFDRSQTIPEEHAKATADTEWVTENGPCPRAKERITHITDRMTALLEQMGHRVPAGGARVEDCSRYKNDRLYKNSFHIYMPGVVFEDNGAQGAGLFFSLLYAQLDPAIVTVPNVEQAPPVHGGARGSLSIVDLGIYTKNRMMRFPGSSKFGEPESASPFPGAKLWNLALQSDNRVPVTCTEATIRATAATLGVKLPRSKTHARGKRKRPEAEAEHEPRGTTNGGVLVREITTWLRARGDAHTIIRAHPERQNYWVGATHPTHHRKCLLDETHVHKSNGCFVARKGNKFYYHCFSTAHAGKRVLLGQLEATHPAANATPEGSAKRGDRGAPSPSPAKEQFQTGRVFTSEVHTTVTQRIRDWIFDFGDTTSTIVPKPGSQTEWIGRTGPGGRNCLLCSGMHHDRIDFGVNLLDHQFFLGCPSGKHAKGERRVLGALATRTKDHVSFADASTSPVGPLCRKFGKVCNTTRTPTRWLAAHTRNHLPRKGERRPNPVVTCIRADKKLGKTYQSIELSAYYVEHDQTVVYVGHRKSQGRSVHTELTDRLPGFVVAYYLDKGWQDANVIVMQYESLWKIAHLQLPAFGLVVLDEIHGLFENLTCLQTNGDNLDRNLTTLRSLVDYSLQTLIMGADIELDSVVGAGLEGLMTRPPLSVDYYHYTYQALQFKFEITRSEASFVQQIEAALQAPDGRPVGLFCRTKTHAMAWHRHFVDKGLVREDQSKLYVGGQNEARNDRDFADINAALQHQRLMTFTNTISVGINVLLPFARCFVDFRGQQGATARSVTQACGRFRNLENMAIPLLTERVSTKYQLGLLETIKEEAKRGIERFDARLMPLLRRTTEVITFDCFGQPKHAPEWVVDIYSQLQYANRQCKMAELYRVCAYHHYLVTLVDEDAETSDELKEAGVRCKEDQADKTARLLLAMQALSHSQLHPHITDCHRRQRERTHDDDTQEEQSICKLLARYAGRHVDGKHLTLDEFLVIRKNKGKIYRLAYLLRGRKDIQARHEQNRLMAQAWPELSYESLTQQIDQLDDLLAFTGLWPMRTNTETEKAVVSTQDFKDPKTQVKRGSLLLSLSEAREASFPAVDKAALEAKRNDVLELCDALLGMQTGRRTVGSKSTVTVRIRTEIGTLLGCSLPDLRPRKHGKRVSSFQIQIDEKLLQFAEQSDYFTKHQDRLPPRLRSSGRSRIISHKPVKIRRLG